MDERIILPPTSEQSVFFKFCLKEGLLGAMEVQEGVPAERKAISQLLLGRSEEQGREPDFIEDLKKRIEIAYPN